jgi:hypothetical protein
MVMISDASEHAKAVPVMLYLYVPSWHSKPVRPRSWSRWINSMVIAPVA